MPSTYQGTSLGLIHLAQACSYYAHGTQLTQAGNQALVCLAAGGVLACFQPGLALTAQRLLSNTNKIQIQYVLSSLQDKADCSRAGGNSVNGSGNTVPQPLQNVFT